MLTPWKESYDQPEKKVKVKLVSHVQLFVTPWTVAYQVLTPVGLSHSCVSRERKGAKVYM